MVGVGGGGGGEVGLGCWLGLLCFIFGGIGGMGWVRGWVFVLVW